MAADNANHTGDELENVSPEFLDEAMLVLAGSDAENCSYSKGYVKRQAVFACSTCTSNPDEPAGICLACANKCHDGHDIFELYTKRNFRCDCGNRKFGEFKCQLIPSRDPENVKNQYNHNFHGNYCTCERPHPDPDGEENGEMIQCVICEDWHHSGHLGCIVVEPEESQEMVCEGCMNKAPFLWTYATHFAVPPVVNVSPEDGEEEVDVEEEVAESDQSGIENPSTSDTSAQEEAESQSFRSKRKHEEETSRSSAGDPARTALCRLKELESRAAAPRPKEGAVFWPLDWRSQLCTCTSCKRAYVSAQIQFLLDPSDTLVAYQEKGLDEPFGQNLLSALTESMDRVQQLEVIYGIQEMTTALTTFFQKCVDEGKSVTAEGVSQCFEELQERSRKRHRTDPGNQ